MARSAHNIQHMTQTMMKAPSTVSSFRTLSQPTRRLAAKRSSLHSSQRGYSSSSINLPNAQHLKSNLTAYSAITSLSLLFGTGVYYYTAAQQQLIPASLPFPSAITLTPSKKSTTITTTEPTFIPTHADYQSLYSAIASSIWSQTSYDDGSYAPILLRLAWHSSGTYDAVSQTGGSNGGLMRFPQGGESTHAANKGLHNARDFLEPVHEKFPWISYGDLWTLAGVVAVQEMGGPVVPWRPGREDWVDSDDRIKKIEEGRLPDGSKGEHHVRAVFKRMGFQDDEEMVALSGAHAVGRCHVGNSGFEGPWTFSPTVFTNEYYKLLLGLEWEGKEQGAKIEGLLGWKEGNKEAGEEEGEMQQQRGQVELGQKQYMDAKTGSIMMLPTDMALVKDEGFREWVVRYASDEDCECLSSY